jgi:hypothetical protein
MNIFQVGGKFEFDWMWYIQSQDFFVRRALPIVSDSGIEDATDIDIWGIRFFPPMAHSLAVVDCKDKGKRSKTYERILWAKGMAAYVSADQVYVAPPKATWRTIDFGRRGGVHVMPYEIIERHLHSLPPGRSAYGQARFGLYQDFFAKRRAALKAQPEIAARLFEARNLYLLGSPLTNINRAIEGLKTSADALSHVNADTERQALWLFNCCEFIAAFALNLLKVAEETFTLSGEDRRGLVLKRLTYGDLPAKKAEEIVRLSHELAIVHARQASATGGTNIVPTPDSMVHGLEPPEYAHDVHGLLERIIQKPMLYWNALSVLEAVLFECVVHKLGVTEANIPYSLEPPEGQHVMKATKNCIAVVCDAAHVARLPFWIDLPSAPTEGGTVSQEELRL